MSTRARVVRRQVVLAALATGGATIGHRLITHYRRDLGVSRSRLDTVDRRLVPTPFGPLEYAERGDGEPVLVIHGILQGCDGALLSARDLVADRRVIAPSRFGYLQSAIPPAATLADQADAFAALLDRLGIDRIDVIGISAGATSALQLALRHAERVKHLVILSGNLPGSPTAVKQPRVARLLFADPPLWAIKVLTPSLLARMMGVPNGFPQSAAEAQFVSEMADSLFPVGPRAQGALFDAFVSNADVNSYDLEELTVPTLIVHAQDDPLASYDAARRAAERIPGAVLVGIDSGGHLMLGQTEHLRAEVATFFATPVAARSSATIP